MSIEPVEGKFYHHGPAGGTVKVLGFDAERGVKVAPLMGDGTIGTAWWTEADKLTREAAGPPSEK